MENSKNTLYSVLVLILLWVTIVVMILRLQPETDEASSQSLDALPSVTISLQPSPAETATPLPTFTETPAPPSPTPTPPPLLLLEPHQVQTGETIQRIAAQHRTSMALIGIYLTVDELTPGQLVQIPVPNPAACSSGKIHVVEENQTLFGISRLYNTTVDQLLALNHKADDLLMVGDLLCLP